MKLKLIKSSTVLIRRPCLTKMAGVRKLIPLISFGGVELNAYGFEVGRRYEIYGQEDRLVLKAPGTLRWLNLSKNSSRDTSKAKFKQKFVPGTLRWLNSGKISFPVHFVG